MAVVEAVVDAGHAAVLIAALGGGGNEAVDVGVGPRGVADGVEADETAEGGGGAFAESGAGHEAIGAGDAEALEETFVVGEEERFVAADGATEIGAELVEAEGGGAGAVEGAAGVEGAIAEEFKNGAVEFVGAGF